MRCPTRAAVPADLAVRAFDQGGQAMIIADARSRIVAANRAFCALTGHRAEDLVGTGARALAAGPDESDWFGRLADSVAQACVFEGEVRGRRPDGGRYRAWGVISPLRDSSGVPSHFP